VHVFGLDKLIERHILKARAEGQLNNLAGEGKPLPQHPESAYQDEATAVGYRLMAEAGVVPREIELKRDIARLREQFAQAPTEADRKAILRRLADAEMRHAIEKEARLRMMRD